MAEGSLAAAVLGSPVDSVVGRETGPQPPLAHPSSPQMGSRQAIPRDLRDTGSAYNERMPRPESRTSVTQRGASIHFCGNVVAAWRSASLVLVVVPLLFSALPKRSS